MELNDVIVNQPVVIDNVIHLNIALHYWFFALLFRLIFYIKSALISVKSKIKVLKQFSYCLFKVM